MIFDFSAIAARDRHKLLTSTVVPRPIAWVSTLSAAGTANLAPFAFFNVFGDEPPVVGLGIHNGPSGPTDTGGNIIETKEFVVNLVPTRAVGDVEVTARAFPPEADEFAKAGLGKLASHKIRPPRVEGSPVAFECVLLHKIDLGPSRWIAIGEVLLAHVADELVLDAARFHIDTERLDLLSRVHAGKYARIGEIVEKPEPVPA